jgi:hypothetical protein
MAVKVTLLENMGATWMGRACIASQGGKYLAPLGESDIAAPYMEGYRRQLRCHRSARRTCIQAVAMVGLEAPATSLYDLMNGLPRSAEGLQ